MQSWFAHEELDVVLAEEDGQLVGYGDRWRERERGRAWFDLAVRPGDDAARATLLRELEARAAPDVAPGAYAMT